MERLIATNVFKTDNIARIISYNMIEREMVPAHLKSMCCTVEIAKENSIVNEERSLNGIQIQVPVATLIKKKIVLGTCSGLGSLMPLDLQNELFSHVLIDEVGQLIEPETLIPTTLMDKTNGQIIMAGDPMQLGPITFSKYAAKFGLATSYLSRLMDLPLYKKNSSRDAFNPVLITQLIYNYRSLPTLLNVYNDLFYDSTLVPMIHNKTSDEAAMLKNLQPALAANTEFYDGGAPNVGIHFVPVKGRNLQEDCSPSWFNPIEAKVLITYLTNILDAGVSAEEIGIIAPYQLQCKCLREQLSKRNLKQLPKIGTVEEFQGQERKVMLISTVRTSEAKLDHDRKYSLGFVKESRRLNVAISRAR